MLRLEEEIEESPETYGPASLAYTIARPFSNKWEGKDQHPRMSPDLYTLTVLYAYHTHIYTCTCAHTHNMHTYTYTHIEI